MESTDNECRFCLKKLVPNEKMSIIDDEIRSTFEHVTSIELQEGLSQIVCDLCLRSLQLASAVKLQFIENQKKLSAANNFCEVAPKRQRTQDSPIYSSDNELITKNEPILEINEIKHENVIDETEDDECVNFLNLPCILQEESPKISNRRKSLLKTQNSSKSEANARVTFECLKCDKSYSCKRHLKRHVNEKHNQLKFTCLVPDCPVTFTRKDKLKRHLIGRHKELSPVKLGIMLKNFEKITPQAIK